MLIQWEMSPLPYVRALLASLGEVSAMLIVMAATEHTTLVCASKRF